MVVRRVKLAGPYQLPIPSDSPKAEVSCKSCRDCLPFYISPRYICRKKCPSGNGLDGRLCQLVDLRLVNLILREQTTPRTIEYLINAYRAVHEGYRQASQEIDRGLRRFPRHEEEFVELVKTLHGQLFSQTQLRIAGTFRSEPVEFGCEPYRFRGAESQEIVLRSLSEK